MITTYIGQKADIGDEICFIKNFKTGSSTIRKCKCCGKITNIKYPKITVHCTKCEISDPVGTNIDVHKDDVICLTCPA